jgi:uncharacterized membrane protein YkvA (DUF1232 family)
MPALWIRLAAFAFAFVVARKAESSVLKGLTSRQTDDLLQRLYSDAEMPRWVRLLARVPWLYRQSPIDLLPDAVPFIGRVDDQVLTTFSLSLIEHLSPRQLFEGHVTAVKPPPPTVEETAPRKRRWFGR